MSRRAAGEGSISKRKVKRKDGTVVETWQASVQDRPDTDPTHRRHFYGKTQAEVREKLTAFRIDMAQGTVTDRTKLTMGQWLTQWLELRRGTVEPQTWTNYKRVVEVRLRPAIGKIRLQRLTDVDVKRMYDGLAEKKRKPSTIRATHDILHTALLAARERGYLHRLPCDTAPLPLVGEHTYPVVVDSAATRFLEAVRGHRMEALYVLALATGMRRGELGALKWEQVDLGSGVVQVVANLIRFKGGWRIKPRPKSRAGLRAITLPDDAVAALEAHRKRQIAERLQAGPAWHDNGFVFATPFGGPILPRYTDRDLHDILEAAGLPRCRFHDLRHSHGTMLAIQKVDPVVAQERMGHSTIAMTLHYRHAVPSLQQDVADKVQKAMQGSRS